MVKNVKNLNENKVELVQKSSLTFLLIGLLALALVAFQWLSDEVIQDNLSMEVFQWTNWAFLESQWTYFYLHIFTFVPVFCLSFDKKVAYYKSWQYLLPAILIVGSLFIAWDVFFTVKEVWGFNDRYLSGIRFFHLPIEEILFFFTVPFACVFIYECLNAYIQKDLLGPYQNSISWSIVIACIAIGLWRFWHMYTATTFLLIGLFVLGHLFLGHRDYRGRFYLAYLVSWLPFMLVNGVLTGGFTQEPIVIYNQEEYLGFRIGSVPFDDSIYSLLLLFSTVSLFEFFKRKAKIKQG